MCRHAVGGMSCALCGDRAVSDTPRVAIPAHARSLFWDTDIATFDPSAFPEYTIARMLEHGTEDDVAWLIRTFGRPAIAGVLRTDPRLSSRSATFWALCFDVPRDQVAALGPACRAGDRVQAPWDQR